MISPLHKGNRWKALGVAVFLLGLGAMIAETAPTWALVNESPSLPRGLYVRAPFGETARGAVVAIPQPDQAQSYLGGLGMPSDVLLLKRVAAFGGDQVCRLGDRIVTPTRTVRVRQQDGRGVILPGWRGCRRLTADEIFLLGDTASSFDSRYFGPVPRSRATGVHWETWTW
jgi:type IV secretory pathway protease TraF